MPAEMSLFAQTEHAPIPMPTPKPERRPPAPVLDPAPPGESCPPPALPPLPAIECEEGKLLLTEREAAKALSVCPRTLWQLRQDGDIPCIRIGRAVRYAPADLRAWIAGRRG